MIGHGIRKHPFRTSTASVILRILTPPLHPSVIPHNASASKIRFKGAFSHNLRRGRRVRSSLTSPFWMFRPSHVGYVRVVLASRLVGPSPASRSYMTLSLLAEVCLFQSGVLLGNEG